MDLHRRAFRDITAGYSVGRVLDRPAFIKHLSYADQIGFDAKRDEFYEEARASKIKTDAERLVELREAGTWTEDQERDLNRARTYVLELDEGKRKNLDKPSMVKSYIEKIREAEKDYEQKALARRRLMGMTCETQADEELNDCYIVANIYADPGLTTPLFKDGDFDYLKNGEVSAIVADYNRAIEGCSDLNLKKLAMQPFFQRYFGLCAEDVAAFFDQKVSRLTFYQVDLLRWGRHFHSIYTNHDVSQFPKHVLEDPELLTDYATAAVKGREKLAEQGAGQQNTHVVGVTKEDAKAMGVKKDNSMKQIFGEFGGDVLGWAAKQGG